MLCALRRAIDNQHRCCRGHHIQDANKRLLADEARQPPAQCQQESAKYREQKCVRKPSRTQRRIAYRKSNRGSQRGELRKRKVGKYDITPKNVNSEIAVNQNKRDGRCKRRPEERKRGLHIGYRSGEAKDFASIDTS